MFVCVLAIVGITLAAIVHDRKHMESELNEMNSTLELQVNIASTDFFFYHQPNCFHSCHGAV